MHPGDASALRFASWASTDSVHFVDSVRSVTSLADSIAQRALCLFEPRLGHCHLRASFNGRTAVFQTADVGSIPSARSEPIL